VGRILGISERTAVFHLSNCAQKLGVSSKREAVVRAIALKIIPL
jgi:DNA-binding CsgD family transcriptional regulator